MNSITTAPLHVFRGQDDMAEACATWFLRIAREKKVVGSNPAILSVCLSGGSTPRRLYSLLAGERFNRLIPWERIHWFWGDERFVPDTDERSNFRMVRDAMLAHAPVPPGNVHVVNVNAPSPEAAALQYESDLISFYHSTAGHPAIGTAIPIASLPAFDITLLGLGEDGHTASLFPHHPALNERRRWAVAVEGAREEPRITLTYPVLESSTHVAFLVSGKSKASILGRARSGDRSLPAVGLETAGTVEIFADVAAVPI